MEATGAHRHLDSLQGTSTEATGAQRNQVQPIHYTAHMPGVYKKPLVNSNSVSALQALLIQLRLR